MTRNDLAFVTRGGWVTWHCGASQPTTEDIADRIPDKNASHVVQLIGDQFNVYDLRTLKRFLGGASIGIPVFATEDLDAALMFAIMQATRGENE